MNSFELTLSPQDEHALLAALPPDLPDMVFVSGQHRSGTTFLHQWLADTGRFSFVTPFDIVHFEQLLSLHQAGGAAAARDELDRELRSGQTNRGLDECGVGADVAEEYGFLLSKQGDYSFFTPSLRPDTRPRFESLCRKKLALDPARRPLLLKNPDDHYYSLAAVAGFYPGARWVFTNRHPLAILNSQIKAWVGLLERPNGYFARISPFYRTVVSDQMRRAFLLGLLQSRRQAEHMLSQMLGALEHYRAHLSTLPADSWIELRYEDVCADPATQLARLAGFLGCPAPPDPSAVVRARPLRILPHLHEVFDAHRERAEPLLAFLGYGVAPDEV